LNGEVVIAFIFKHRKSRQDSTRKPHKRLSRMRLGFTLVCSAAMLALIGVPVAAKEYPIGKAQEKDGMEIGAVYLQPIEMAPPT